MIEYILAIGVHLGTIHTNVDNNYTPDDVNPGIYLETVDNWMGGVYYNSDRKSTVYVGKALHYGTSVGDVSLMVGLATGYRNVITPAIIPAYNVPLAKDFYGKIWYVPKVNSGAEAVHFSIEWRIK